MKDNLYSDINGELCLSAAVAFSSRDIRVRSRYGVYETLLWRNGVPELAAAHWERLFRGLELLEFNVPQHYTGTFFEEHIRQVAAMNAIEELGRVRVQVLATNEQAPYAPFFYIQCLPLDLSVTLFNTQGLVTGILPGYRKERGPLANLKLSHNRHEEPAAAARQVYGWDEVLLCNDDGRPIESEIANLFWISNGIVYTPPLEEGCIAGTMRGWIIRQLQDMAYPLEEKACTETILLAADEIFLANSIRPIRWVGQLGNTRYDHRLTLDIYHRLNTKQR